jgi:branched-chain amino acid transport system permease protein
MSGLLLSGIVNGVILGLLYSLIGVSLSLLYGVLQVKNFAHGEFLIAGAYLCYVLFVFLGIHPLIALPIVFVAFAGVGWVLYYLIMPRLNRAEDPMMASLLVMYGLSLIIAAGLLFLFGADYRALTFSFQPIAYSVGPLFIPTARIVAVCAVLVITAIMTWFLFFTLPGKAIRAAISNPGAVQIVGVDLDRLSAWTFAIAIGLAGATGVLVALVFPSFNPFIGVDYTLIGFIVVVLGGLGNPMGALLGGLVYGLTEQVSIVYMPQTLASILGFSMMVLVIYLRPSGILGIAKRV